jgi:Ulp1 family protease
MNDTYMRPLAEKLQNSLLEPYEKLKTKRNNFKIIKKYEVQQGNGYDCGVAVITFIEQIINKGLHANFNDLNNNFEKHRIR